MENFHPHLALAHRYWTELLQPGDNVIDATCGNGKDTLKLAQLLSCESHVVALDIQPLAIERTKKLLAGIEQLGHVHFFEQSHAVFPSMAYQVPIRLIVYNLGYLPGGEKSLTTRRESTLESFASARSLIEPGGMISITCYPGHEEGQHEQAALLDVARTLDPREWCIAFHSWPNRPLSPTLLIIQKLQR